MTEIDYKDIPWLEHGGCAVYVPTREEIAKEGVETRDFFDHPNFSRYDDIEDEIVIEEADSLEDELAELERYRREEEWGEEVLTAQATDRIGRKIHLPSSAPNLPGGYPPYAGARRAWSDRTQLIVARIRRKMPGAVCATYWKHGRTGMPWGIDIMVSHFRTKASRAEEEAGDKLCNWGIRNWNWLHINYIIWWNWMNDGAGWFDYSPWSKPASQGGWPGGDPDPNTRKHEDHNHWQIDNPHRAGNE